MFCACRGDEALAVPTTDSGIVDTKRGECLSFGKSNCLQVRRYRGLDGDCREPLRQLGEAGNYVVKGHGCSAFPKISRSDRQTVAQPRRHGLVYWPV